MHVKTLIAQSSVEWKLAMSQIGNNYVFIIDVAQPAGPCCACCCNS